MNTIEKTFILPSNGLFGGPKEITLRAMTTKEEKILLSTRDFSIFERLVKSCCVEPKDLDIGLLHQNDIMYLTYALRELTFGNTYTQRVECPECGFSQDIEVDIADMKLDILDITDIESKLRVTLPVNGDTLQLKILSVGDTKKLDKIVKTKTAQGKLLDPNGYEFTIRLMETIVNINGEDFESEDYKRNYVDTLNLRDLVTIQNKLNEIDFGLDTSILRECSKCKEEMKVRGYICPEFFRPSK